VTPPDEVHDNQPSERCSVNPEVPHLPETFPPVDEAFTGPCLLEVRRDERGGRGRFWRPQRAGYTDDLLRAGVYSAAEARAIARGGHTSNAVDARAALQLAEARLHAFRVAVLGAPAPQKAGGLLVPAGYVRVELPPGAPVGAREAYCNGATLVITGEPANGDVDAPEYEQHNCDVMGCRWDHVLERRDMLWVVADACCGAQSQATVNTASAGPERPPLQLVCLLPPHGPDVAHQWGYIHRA
jgi:hypothetical protein